MERPKREASKVSNFRKYHLSGELEELIHGKVGSTVTQWEGITNTNPGMDHGDSVPQQSAEQLRAILEEQEAQSQKLQEQAETMRLHNEVERHKMNQRQWEVAIEQLQAARKAMELEHSKNLDKLKQISEDSVSSTKAQAVAWLEQQLAAPKEAAPKDELKKAEEERIRKVNDLKQQQEELQKQILAMEAGGPLEEHSASPLNVTDTAASDQELWLQQVRAALGPKEAQDSNRTLLKALVTGQNRATGLRGTTTLRPEILNKITTEEEFSMARWLASLNKQDEGESDFNRCLSKVVEDSDCRQECRHSKIKSGMLDKSTTNIQRKEVWPQKNLGEDWAEEEIEFKQLRFKHLVAGETRTIETCTDPAQILGRLRLLRHIAYLKLRGIEWHLLRKMYAAILSSIETREYSWESNFDRFESILYRKALTEASRGNNRSDREHRQEGRKRYCKDYNKDGCP